MTELHGQAWCDRFFERSGDGIYVADLQGNLLATNPAFRRFLGYSEAEMLGMNVMATVAPEGLEYASSMMAELLRSGEIHPFEAMLRRKDGSLAWAEISAQIATTETGSPTHMDGVVRDSTERHLLEETLRRTVADLETAQAVKDEFLALVSHELRTPLTSIKGYAELLAEEELTSDQVKFVAGISSGSDRMVSLIEDLLLMTQIQSGDLPLELGQAMLADLIASAAESATPFANSKHISLSIDTEPDLATEGDSRRLGQAIDNLVSNAIKYTPNGGAVSITSTHSGDTATITVSDSGIGIPDAEQTQMFGRFFRTSNARASGVGGTGLGLAITRGIIEAHGGTIGFDSTEGTGTTFRITLPHAHLLAAAA